MQRFNGGMVVTVMVMVVLGMMVCLVSAQKGFGGNGTKTNTPTWLTLNGSAPLVIARGGFSGLFPDSSFYAYNFTPEVSVQNVVLWCDVQLTKDGDGICFPQMLLNNATNNINMVFPKDNKTYEVNGVSTNGWFTIDFTRDDLKNVGLAQPLWNRMSQFDFQNILTVDDVYNQLYVAPVMWLNVQYDAFYTQHNLSMRSYVLSVSKRIIVDYVSSPEVGFLRSIEERLRASKTKLIFRFPIDVEMEPSTNQSYSSLLKNLTFIKTFASGILVPKSYIWPVDTANYLQPYTSLVSDAHKEGLQVFASEFTNDIPFSYNYSYDPISEYLSFIDNGDFSVDGVLSDFPITPSAAIGCYSHVSRNSSRKGIGKDARVLTVISHNGASGVYPGSTDSAYNQAIEDGADFIDCSVQMTSDGIPICLSSYNLLDSTNVAESAFSSQSLHIPELNLNGIFTFNLTWEDIQTLKPVILSPQAEKYGLRRNPAHTNDGKFMSLANFLIFAKSKTIAGVLISIENAAYLAEKQGLDVIGAVLDALSKSDYNNQTAQEVIIQSTNKAVLTKFKKQTKYSFMYMVDEEIRGADKSTLEDIKSFADSVAISKSSVFPDDSLFTTGDTKIVENLQAVKLAVYVYLFTNEYISLAWDFYCDPYVELNSYAISGINGVITDFPGTAVTYTRSKCLPLNDKSPGYALPTKPGNLLAAMEPELLPPAEAPGVLLTESDVSEPPLPAVIKPGTNDTVAASPPGSPKSGHPRNAVCVFMSSLSIILTFFMF